MEPDSGIPALVRAQGSDGGWGYHPASHSWTEPTALAVLALSQTTEAQNAVTRGREWLVQMQRSDGGWPPCAAVDQSTWVTSFASMALVGGGSGAVLAGARDWLLHHSGRGLSALDRLRNWLMREPGDRTPSGWSWYPGTASWVIPTAASLLALNKMPNNSTSIVRARVADGRSFLMARECAGGGWNHGGTFVRSENAEPYPETTGLALLALRGGSQVRLGRSLAHARQMLHAPQSVQGAAWLRMGLAAHGSNATVPVINRNRNWTTVDTALEEIASLAQNPFLT